MFDLLYQLFYSITDRQMDRRKDRLMDGFQLCTILNDMYHVKRTLSEMPVTLELESYYEWLNDNCRQLGDKVLSVRVLQQQLVTCSISTNGGDPFDLIIRSPCISHDHLRKITAPTPPVHNIMCTKHGLATLTKHAYSKFNMPKSSALAKSIWQSC